MLGSSMTTFGVFAGLLATQASGHLFIKYPAPPLEGPEKSPLDPSGSNFPCHGAAIGQSQGIKMAAGSSQLLQFDDGGGANTAVHGGGSCQLSLYYGPSEGDAKKDPKNWKVIHSMEGGCPTNAEGNLPTSIQCSDPGSDGVNCLNSFNFTIPSGVKSGQATWAWTWFNTVGNREMYMNCVDAQIEGGDGSEMDELPTLFVANLGGGLPQCSTTEGESYKFPYPGQYVTSNTDGSPYKVMALSGGSCSSDGAPAAGAAAGGSEGSGSGAAPSYGGGAPAAPAPSGNAGSGSGSGQVTVTTMQTVTGGNAAPTSAPAPAANPPPAPSAAAPAPYASGSGSSGSSSSGGSTGGQPCSTDGEVVCMGTQFGICDHGFAVPQPLAAGTTCTNGKIAKRDHIRRHVGRKHGRRFA